MRRDHHALVFRLETNLLGVKQYTNARRALPEPYQPKQRIKGGVLFKKLVEEVEN